MEKSQEYINMIQIKRTHSADPDFHLLIKKLDRELGERYGNLQQYYSQFNKIENNNTVVLAYMDSRPVGCGCFKSFDENIVEIKRMYVDTAARSHGIGSTILSELEKWAVELQLQTIVLELGNKQPEAMQLYTKQGYTRIPNYGQYTGMESSICMKKDLTC